MTISKDTLISEEAKESRRQRRIKTEWLAREGIISDRMAYILGKLETYPENKKIEINIRLDDSSSDCIIEIENARLYNFIYNVFFEQEKKIAEWCEAVLWGLREVGKRKNLTGVKD